MKRKGSDLLYKIIKLNTKKLFLTNNKIAAKYQHSLKNVLK